MEQSRPMEGRFAPDRPPKWRLRVPATRLIGRQAQVTAVSALLRDGPVRLVTLTGPGGVGKTRVAIAVAASLEPVFETIHFASLGPIQDPELVPSAISHAVGLQEADGRSALEHLTAALGDRNLLLVVDSMEQVRSTAILLSDVLAACPGVKFLVTSRAPLHLLGEREYRVPPLAVPDLNRPFDAGSLLGCPAVELFVERARSVSPVFRLDAENGPAVATICSWLDGIPLAIELAAAQTRLLSPRALAGRIDRALLLLTGGPRDLPARQRTLRDTILWSFNLLGVEEQRAFSQLGVFVGGCSVEAAESLISSASQSQAGAVDVLITLVEHSLVRRFDDRFGQARLDMFETIREFALERLREAGDESAARTRHAEIYLALAESMEPSLRSGPQEMELDRLEAEHDNLRAALHWYLDSGVERGALRLTGALWRFWFLRGYLTEGRLWLQRSLSPATDRTPGVRAKALNGAAVLAEFQTDFRTAMELCEESLAMSRELGDVIGIADALSTRGGIDRIQGAYGAAKTDFETALRSYRDSGDGSGVARMLYQLGFIAWAEGAGARARELFQESLSASKETGNLQTSVQALSGLGWVALNQGEDAAAERLLQEAVVLSSELGDKWNLARAVYSLGRVDTHRGHHGRAWSRHREALAMAHQLGDRSLTCACLEGLATVAVAQGQLKLAVRLLGTADRVAEGITATRFAALQPAYDRLLEQVRSGLSDEEFGVVWMQGRVASVEEALGEVLAPVLEQSEGTPEKLTVRETTVLRLVSQGLTNPEVARRLGLSLRTVDAHLRTVYRKLNVNSRSAATRYAIEHKLV